MAPSPLLLAFLLSIAVLFCSSAGVAFALMGSDVPPFLKASWRLWTQQIFQTIPFILQYRNRVTNDDAKLDSDGNAIDRTFYKNNLPLLAFSGVLLGIHFSSWVWAIDNTSLAHSLMWISMYPICLNVGAWLTFFYVKNVGQDNLSLFCCGSGNEDLYVLTKPSLMETVGTFIGLSGALIMLLDAGHSSDNEKDNEVTVAGDMVAFLGAATMAGYLVIGRVLRLWLPIWLYAFPVCAFSIATSLLFAAVSEDITIGGLNSNSVFGFLSPDYIGYSLYLGACCGVAGHTLLNYLLEYISPLVIASSLLLEPLVGSFIGWCVGIQGLPGIWTWAGGVVLMGGLAAVVVGEHKRMAGGNEGTNTASAASSDMPVGRPNEENAYGHGLDDIDLQVVVDEENRELTNRAL